MLNKKVMAVVLAVAIVAASVFAFANTANVQAQYAPSAEGLCGGQVRFQVRLYGDTTAHANSSLTAPVVLLRATTPDKVRSKWLICENSVNTSSWAIFFVNRILWIPAGSGDIVPRQFRDNQ
ncbi:MAG: hypothetical protein DYG88_17605 [Chloroflexi bacterium CFX4]|nr:hypothetical protein [Chloroflexi bacterium CFX4]MDL1924244.1 hypothetical protein [Chloroflexi bacterium CFX3]